MVGWLRCTLSILIRKLIFYMPVVHILSSLSVYRKVDFVFKLWKVQSRPVYVYCPL
jgi:hypothetical protein